MIHIALCAGVTGKSLYWIMWEGVRRLEQCGFKVASACIHKQRNYYFEQVILFVCDGAKPNRRFFNGMGFKDEKKDGVVYKTLNRYSTDRYIYFISDVPHLIKTTRVRFMWVSPFNGLTAMLAS